MFNFIRYAPTSGLKKASTVNPVPTSETTVIEITDKGFLDEGSQLAIYYDFTLGSLTQAVLRVYIDPGDGKYYEIPGIEEDLTFLADAQQVYAFPSYPTSGSATKLKITVQGTGTNTGSVLDLTIANRNN